MNEQTLREIKGPYERAANCDELEAANVLWLLYQNKIDIDEGVRNGSKIKQHSIH